MQMMVHESVRRTNFHSGLVSLVLCVVDSWHGLNAGSGVVLFTGASVSAFTGGSLLTDVQSSAMGLELPTNYGRSSCMSVSVRHAAMQCSGLGIAGHCKVICGTGLTTLTCGTLC